MNFKCDYIIFAELVTSSTWPLIGQKQIVKRRHSVADSVNLLQQQNTNIGNTAESI